MSKLFSTILLSIILLMLVVGIVGATKANGNLPTPGENEDAGKSSAPGAMPGAGEDDDPGIGNTGDVSTDPKDKAKADENADEKGKENSRDGTPPGGIGPIDIPEFSTIGMLAAGAAAGLGYLYMRKRRK